LENELVIKTADSQLISDIKAKQAQLRKTKKLEMKKRKSEERKKRIAEGEELDPDESESIEKETVYITDVDIFFFICFRKKKIQKWDTQGSDMVMRLHWFLFVKNVLKCMRKLFRSKNCSSRKKGSKMTRIYPQNKAIKN
jgi:hypothetical protein